MKFIIIIPAKNEEDNIQRTLESIITQKKKPELCLVVDDASTDSTAQIVNKIGRQYPFIECHTKNGEDQSYKLGGKIVKSFLWGKELIDQRNIVYDFIIKMDADIQFDPDFLENIEKRLKNNKPGIASGTPYQIIGEKKRYITSPIWHTNGDFKIYNKKCLNEMNGLTPNLGWDCADNIAAMENGWKTIAYRDLFYKQQRPIGKYSILEGRIRQGRGAYVLRYSLGYIWLKLMHDMLKKPFIIGAIYQLYGYLSCYYHKEKRTVTKSQARILRKLLWQSFFERIRNRKFSIFQSFSN